LIFMPIYASNRSKAEVRYDTSKVQLRYKSRLKKMETEVVTEVLSRYKQ
jgi:hypothetical protein